MTSETEPGRDDWRPWGRPDAASGEPTAEIPQAQPETSQAQPEPSQAPAEPSYPPAPVWATSGAPAPYDPYAATAPVPTASTAYPTYPPLTGTTGTEADRGRRGPGWGALFGVAVAVALVAGLLGGLLGGAVAERNRSTDAGPAPSVGAGATTRASGTVANIAARATPSVVTLQVEGSDGSGTGSGWVYDTAGHIVTNNHVVAGAADNGTITVVLANGQQLKGSVVGRDASYDLAVVKVDRTDLAPLTLGRSADVVVGDEVIAVGAPLGLDSTVTAGIVSALNRPVTPGEDDDQAYINAIQTDAAINPGNSGGPLLDMQGQVIGVNSAIATAPGTSLSGQGGNIGVGFAIPSDQVATTVQQLITTGKAVHPVIGVYLDSGYTGEGVRVADEGPDGQPAVNPDGPADKAGLEAGDVVVKFDGRPVSSGSELVVAIRARTVGEKVTLTIRRDGTERDVTMELKGSGE
jgi:putative serine protease PepD